MSAAPTPPSASRIDVRTLSLTQLQQLAGRGSRRARAELEGRMRAAAPRSTPVATARPAMNDVFVPTARPVAPAPRGRRPPADLPVLTERAHPSGPAPLATARAAAVPQRAPAPQRASQAPQPAPQPAPASVQAGMTGPAPLNEALHKQLELIARQEDRASRTSGPPRLLGMVLIAWGALLVLGGLISLAHGGGFYYLFCGLGSAGVGWLLMRCSRWAMVAHGVLLLIALGWAWRSSGTSFGLALVQAAPVWIAALWMAVQPVRDGLE